MTESELNELTGGTSKPEFTSEEILALAHSLVEAVQKNEANLTPAGMERGVAERIAGFLRHRLSSPNEPAASRWTVRRPTKPGWYWLNMPGLGVRVVEVKSSCGGTAAVGIDNVFNLHGAKWCGPIEEPR